MGVNSGELLLSKNHMLKTRFVAIKLSTDIVEERIRKAAVTAKKQGRTLFEEKKSTLKMEYVYNKC